MAVRIIAGMSRSTQPIASSHRREADADELERRPERPIRRILTQDSVRDRVPVDKATLWRWERDGKFPRRVKLGSRVGWFEDEVDAWQEQRAAERGKRHA